MTLYWKKSQDIQILKENLNKDRVAVVSGDTVLGLLGRMTQKSYDAINTIKNRTGKPCLVLIRSAQMLSKFIDQDLDQTVSYIVNNCWPGPLTLIFKAKSSLPDYMKNSDGTIALRVPNHQGLLNLLQDYDGLFSTSANLHTENIPKNVQDINKKIIDQVAAVCLDVENQEFDLVPSTILDCSSGEITIIREGCCLTDDVRSLLK